MKLIFFRSATLIKKHMFNENIKFMFAFRIPTPCL